MVELGCLWGVAQNEAQFLCHEIEDVASPQVSTHENGHLLKYADTSHEYKKHIFRKINNYSQMDGNKTEECDNGSEFLQFPEAFFSISSVHL